MKRLRLWGAILAVMLLSYFVFFMSGNGMSVFNKQVWSASDFSDLMQDETMVEVYKPISKDVLGKVGMELVLPDSSLAKSTVKIMSYRLYDKAQNNIYVGPYKEVIILDVDKALLGEGKSKDDGYDSLKITFIDEVNRTTYTCEQERPFHMWQLNKVVTINFLPQRKLDKNGQPYCYDAYIHRSIKG
ncbi:hypothetical protein [Aeromonas enteropelogenes]|uniref:Uncharacterized protein n=1 Tax=Aeromonas enteropelogenes TaxID=29489 RepID=A0ABU9J6C9_AEREN